MSNTITKTDHSQNSNSIVKKLDLAPATNYSVYNDVNRAIATQGKSYPMNQSFAFQYQELIRRLSKFVNIAEQNITLYSGNYAAHKAIFQSLSFGGDSILVEGQIEDYFAEIMNDFGFNSESCHKGLINYDLQGIASKVNNSVKFVYLQNPGISDSRPIEKEELKNILDLNRTAIFILDETYIEYSGQSLAELVDEYDNLIVIRTFSKALGLAGFEVSYLIANSKLISQINLGAKSGLALGELSAAINTLDNLGLIYRKIDSLSELQTYRVIYLRSLGIVCRPSCAGSILLKSETPNETLKKIMRFAIPSGAALVEESTKEISILAAALDDSKLLDYLVGIFGEMYESKRVNRKLTISRGAEASAREEFNRIKISKDFETQDDYKGGAIIQEENQENENFIPI